MEPVIPQSHFKPHPEPDFVNDKLYIPKELAIGQKTKTVYVASAMTRLKRQQHQVQETNNDSAKNGNGAKEGEVEEGNGEEDNDEDEGAAKRIKLEIEATNVSEEPSGRPKRATRKT